MIVYYDIVSGCEVASDAYEESMPCAGIKAIQSKRITVQETEADIGANASAEVGEEDEGVDASEAKTVINLVHASNLQTMELSKSEYKSMQKAYWKKLLEALNKQKFKALGFPSDYEVPSDKTEAKEAEQKAADELSSFDRRAYDDVLDKVASFKKNFEGLQKFIADEILANYDELEFYLADGADLDSCMIVPARYIGEATAPIFYILTDGIKEKKE